MASRATWNGAGPRRRLWLLQADPITTASAQEREQVRREEVARLRELADPRGTVWARYNLAEVLPTPTPMTWAIVSHFMSGQGGLGLMFRDLGFYDPVRSSTNSDSSIWSAAGPYVKPQPRGQACTSPGFPCGHKFNELPSSIPSGPCIPSPCPTRHWSTSSSSCGFPSSCSRCCAPGAASSEPAGRWPSGYDRKSFRASPRQARANAWPRLSERNFPTKELLADGWRSGGLAPWSILPASRSSRPRWRRRPWPSLSRDCRLNWSRASKPHVPFAAGRVAFEPDPRKPISPPRSLPCRAVSWAEQFNSRLPVTAASKKWS